MPQLAGFLGLDKVERSIALVGTVQSVAYAVAAWAPESDTHWTGYGPTAFFRCQCQKCFEALSCPSYCDIVCG